MAAVAWVLNLDADLELAANGPYAPTRAVLEAMRPHVRTLARTLLGDGDVLVEDSSDARGLAGRAWCPTARAIETLRRAGAVPEPHPSMNVLRRVNSRVFAMELGPTLEGAELVRDLGRALEILARPPKIGAAWRLKRAFGMAGRGQRVVAPGTLSSADVAFVRASLEHGLVVEPQVAIEREYGLHGVVDRSGGVRLGDVVVQRCDPRGAWVATEPSRDVPHEGELRAEALRVAEALHQAGYFGPFGVDSFTYRDRDGALRLQPRSDVNARFSMGFAIGFTACRR